jgi:hypothetical protein
MSARRTAGSFPASSAATSAFAWDVTNAFAPQSFTMYSTSGAVRRELIAV